MTSETKTYLNLTVLTGILSDPLIAAFADYRNGKTEQTRARFLHELFEKKAEENFAAYVAKVVLYDENAFSRACAAGDKISLHLQKAYIGDLKEIGSALDMKAEDFTLGSPEAPIKSWDDKAANLLYGYYQSYGYGKYINCIRFRYDKKEGIVPYHAPVSVSVEELKGYEREKAAVYDNLENFVKGFPCSDMLLYGDRGTGKSSTVHAMTAQFASQKLRLIEISKEDIADLPKLKELLAAIPLRFLIFIDDFSLGEKDDRISTLKAALQGSGGGRCDNVMIVVTSNRRHLLDESVSNRENSMHRNENEQELLSLSDRFGVTVLFASTDKAQYLKIVHEIAKDMKLDYPKESIDALAERWAIVKGGRSPRRAKQFVGYLVACNKKGKEPRF